MIYKLFIEGTIGKTIFCGYLVRNPQGIMGFFIEISQGTEMCSGAFKQIFLRKAYEPRRSKRRLLFGIE